MAAQTYLQLVNKVLVRLRESTVATVTETSYSTLIGALMNRVKSEIEDAWRWHALRDTYQITTTPGTATYVLTDSGPDAVIIDAYNTSQQRQMERGNVRDFNNKFFGVTTAVTGNPTQFLEGGLNVDFDLSIDIWPIPATGVTDVIKFNIYVPQAELSAGSDVPLVPQNVLVEGTVARAIMERGDDGGVAIQSQEALYRELLSSAIARDAGRDEFELIWSPL